MKHYRSILLAALVACLGAGVTEAGAHTSVSIGVFTQDLGPYGYWVDVAPYGRCWYPSYVGSQWRPYCSGQWVWTDGGWYWWSDEPWAWACYHYGRWAQDSYYGWVWVPGYEWSGSWVSWRQGGGYVGWAPLPPGCDFGGRSEIGPGQIILAPSAFVFVDVHHFDRPVRRNEVIVNNRTIIRDTINVTRIQRVNNTVFQGGPSVESIQKLTGRPLKTSRSANALQDSSEQRINRNAGASPFSGNRRVEKAPVTPAAPAMRGNPGPAQASGVDRAKVKASKPIEVLRGSQPAAEPTATAWPGNRVPVKPQNEVGRAPSDRQTGREPVTTVPRIPSQPAPVEPPRWAAPSKSRGTLPPQPAPTPGYGEPPQRTYYNRLEPWTRERRNSTGPTQVAPQNPSPGNPGAADQESAQPGKKRGHRGGND